MTQKPDHVVYGTRSDITDTGFFFACHPDVPCFTRCCRDTDMYLYPYDIIRLKHSLNMDSEAFLDAHTNTAIRDNPYFPHVMLKMADSAKKPCPFLTSEGCSVYEDRPFSCRAYPVEPALSRDGRSDETARYYIVRHPYCRGHEQDRYHTAEGWIADQGLEPFLEHNRRWAVVDTLLRRNHWGDQGLEHPAVKMVFMAAYNMDRFREFVFHSSFLERFAIARQRLDAIGSRDTELMHLGFDWIEFILAGTGPLAGCRKS
ncbi:MAG TPA: YkgJ family cysteine cluster protein [Desulfosalsimonadaceae bacterium]|nr:YkgJ family cysteine cluster protein [Desulfosalsimonadaceae bacterium]